MSMRLSEVSQWIDASRTGPDCSFSSVSTDSRSIRPGDLYVALRGANFDGHDFVASAEAAGAVASLTDHPVVSGRPQLQVEDTLLALGRLAAGWRWKMGLPVVGITGSNGKTTVKEMTAAILAKAAPVFATRGNLNNEIGVPLSLLSIRPEHRYAVIEMGASKAGDIAYSTGFARHDVAILTNAGAAHLAGFGDVDGVARAKGEIVSTLPGKGIAVLNADDVFFEYWHSLAAGRRVISFGLEQPADFTASDIRTGLSVEGFHCEFRMHYGDDAWSVSMPVAGRHNVRNALAAAAAAMALGLGRNEIIAGLASLRPVKGRLQVKQGVRGAVLLDDSYNGNPSSLKAALELIASQSDRPGWIALGDFAELGAGSGELHRQVGQWAREYGIQRLYATGSEGQSTVAGFGKGAQYFPDRRQLAEALRQDLQGDEIVLVKGSRSQAMETVIEALIEEGETD